MNQKIKFRFKIIKNAYYMKIIRKIKSLILQLNGYNIDNPNLNGEYKLLKRVLLNAREPILFDVGANVGNYSIKASLINKSTKVFAFEPVEKTFEILTNNCKKFLNVNCNKIAISDRIGKELINVYFEDGGANSIYFMDYHANLSNQVQKQEISTITIDEFVKINKISRIDILKIDVEGYEPNVIIGAMESLKSGIVKNIQFEFGDYWLNSTHNLSEIVTLLSNLNYKIYRVTPFGLSKINKVLKNSKKFVFANYFAVFNG